jgi:mono/diheme cytochrome c family protein
MCAPKGTLPITATDALVCLKRAIGQGVTLRCPCEVVTTTLDVTTTTTTTSTTTSSTTTTTLGGSVQAGQAHYDAVCSACHRAGSHDTNGFAPNLAGKGDLLVNNLGSIDPMMSGITLTNKQILNLAAFLDSL